MLALATAVLTPITANAGEWLYDLRRNPSPGLREHAARGDTMIYFAIALFLGAVALVVLHLIERRSTSRHLVTNVVVAIVVIAVGIATIVQTYRIGDTGAQSVWGNEIAHLKQANAN
jgi:tellurite resistance protein TehA-like permease